MNGLIQHWRFTARALLVLFVSATLPPHQVLAQEDCRTALVEAEKKFENGLLYEVLELLTPCVETIKKEQPKVQAIRAYELLALSYLGTDQDKRARYQARQILKLNRDYVPTRTFSAKYRAIIKEERIKLPGKSFVSEQLFFIAGGVLASTITYVLLR
ncbi:hypothetical protein GWO43_02935 [candidate division KSB1 bacterium]|nr:hypothetical protein [candidate division KSB1 bacterium]NIR69902.1 hypothetical protein [candidate division KSB1 bacterium]NIS23004.1 hypothetical protein [candidate division KSB1 bacterium]NIT69862.1 hypothetical protein [candidate division KSB1 bacterium]NIU23511.1 hypothetical protein [candidate division KSB1 bacterium]